MDIRTLQRFEAKYTVLDDGCWSWRGATVGRGYGVMDVGCGSRLVHRISYEHFRGSIPDGLTIDHLCQNKSCVNPDHLEVVTRTVNNLRGTSAAAMNARKTHCPAGHEYVPENTYRDKRGIRHCRSCHRVREHQRKIMGRNASE